MRRFASAVVVSTIVLAQIPAAQAEIVIGFVTGTSGPLSSIGIPNAKGVAAGLAYQSEVGGEKIRLIQLDDASDPTTATRNARKLVEQDKVDFLLGTSGAPQTFAMATTAIELKTPMVAVSPINQPPAGEGGPWVVQIPLAQPLLMKAVVDDMKARHVKTVGFIGFSDALGDLMHGALAEAAEKAGIKVLNDERYARTDTSVAGQVLKTISLKPDAVLIGGTATPGALPALALSERGFKGPVYGNNGLISQDFIRVAGKAAEGIICPIGPVVVAEQLPDSNPMKKMGLAYQAAYEKANGAPPTDGFAPNGFDGYLVFLDAAKRALATGVKPGTPEFKEALRKALFTTKEMVGSQAIYNFTPASSLGSDERGVVLVKLQGGKWKLMNKPGE